MNTKILSLLDDPQAAIDLAALLIRNGETVAFPTETVYGLGASATDAEAVRRIFLAKGRPGDNPLIVHVSDLKMAWSLTNHWTKHAETLSRTFWPGPLSIVVAAAPAVPKAVTAGLDSVAIRMPNHAAALKLIELCGPIAAPSANASGRPSPVNANHVYEDLNGKVPLILDGGECEIGVESTVVDARGDVPVVLRPGGVTVEMIRSVCGSCALADGVFAPVKTKAASPGMLHAHYTPNGRATLVMPHDAMARTLAEQYDAAVKQGFMPVVLCSGDTAKLLGGCAHIRLDDNGGMAHGLFDALRRADANGYDRLFIEGVPTGGMGAAYMNRALRAAGFDLWEDMT